MTLRRLVPVLLLAAACTEAPPKPGTAAPATADPAPQPVEPRTPQKADDDSPPSITTADDLRFVIKRFNWESGGHYGLVVEADGSMTVVWEKMESVGKGAKRYVQPVWFKRTVTLSPDQLESVRAALVDADFLELDPLYKDPDIEDGYSDEYQLRAHGQTHTVTCANQTPPQIRSLDAVLKPIRKDAEQEGERLDRAQMNAFWAKILTP